MATDNERREVAARLRNVEKHIVPDAKISYNPMTVEFVSAAVFYDLPYVRGLFARLADLIDPTCEVHRDALFYPATDLTPEYEETVYRCGKCEEIVSYDADYDPETDLPAYCERCGSRITGIGEPWDE